MMKKNLIWALFLVSILCISGAIAYMPVTHGYMFDSSKEIPINSEMYKACAKYPDLCYSGDVMTDVSVIFYFLDRSKYSSTHSPSFCRTLLENSNGDEEMACAVGSCLHLAQDMVSHNELVPNAVLKTKLKNSVVHIFAEQKVDNYLTSKYPTLERESKDSLSQYKSCMPLFKKAMIGDPSYNDYTDAQLDELFDKFITEYQNSQTGYDAGFKTKSFLTNIQALPMNLLAIYIISLLGLFLICALLVIKIVRKEATLRHKIGLIIFLPIFLLLIYIFAMNMAGRGFQAIMYVVKPISNLVTIGDAQYFVDRAVTNSKELLTQGEMWLSGMDPTGFINLDSADASVAIFDYMILIVLSLTLIWFIWFLFKKNKVKAFTGYSI